MSAVASFFQQIGAVLSSYRPFQDTLDILIVTLIIYELIKLIRKTRSVQIVKGLVLLFLVYLLVIILDMPVMKFLFSTIFSSILVILVIIFTPELRNLLEHMGRSSFSRLFGQRVTDTIQDEVINNVCGACSEMSDDKIGALIVFERKSMLGEIMHTGTEVDANVTSSLLRNIFYPKSPLHDGATIISHERIAYAGCILPLTDTTNLNAKFGTRHRAALGVTEQSDAVVAVVSEETGAISFVEKGYIKHDITSGELRDCLLKALADDTGIEEKKKRFSFPVKKRGGKTDEK